MSKIKFISIEGNIGSGIDNFCLFFKQNKILANYSTSLSEEERDENLTNSLMKEPTKNAFSFLIRSFLNRLQKKTICSKRSIISDFYRLEAFFELEYINLNEYNICKDLYNSLKQNFPKEEETMFIYLKSNENLCYERLIEQGVKYLYFNYISTLNKYYENLCNLENVLVIDYDKYNEFNQRSLIVFIESFYEHLNKKKSDSKNKNKNEWTVVSSKRNRNRKN